MKNTVNDEMSAQKLQHDHFDLMLRRQGWLLIRHKPIDTDPNVIRVSQVKQVNHHSTLPKLGQNSPHCNGVFYEAFSDNTFRKLLRYIFFHKSGTTEELKRICNSEPKLEKHLQFMLEHKLIIQQGCCWQKGPAYVTIDNIGPTLEWYVAQWFRSWLEVPARHGVAIKDVADGGDLDVVAFVDGIRVMVECKSGSPAKITENDIRLFLRRADEFNPEMAILLIDTDGRIDPVIDMANRLQTSDDPFTPQDTHDSLYWGVRHIYIMNTRSGIPDALSAALRLYYSKIRHMAFGR